MYHGLGLTTKEIFADLKAAGWDKSLRTLQSHQTELRKEGLLPAHNCAAGPSQRERNRIDAESCNESVENSEPQEKITKAEQVLVAAKQRKDIADEKCDEVIELYSNQETHVLTNEELEVLQNAVDSVKEWQALATKQADEIERLKQTLSTQSKNDTSSVRLLRPELEGEPSTQEITVYARPEHESYIAPPIDWNWHPGLEVGSEACNDFNDICHRISDIDDRLSKYFLTGIWGPREWAAILGHLQAPSDRANAQRRFRPKGDDGKLIKVR